MDNKTFEEKLTDFTTALQEKLKPMIEKRQNDLLEKDLDLGSEGDYFVCYDSDEVNVGVGSLTVREETIQNEDQAYEDAQEEIAEQVANLEEEFYTLFEDNKISSLLADIIRSL